MTLAELIKHEFNFEVIYLGNITIPCKNTDCHIVNLTTKLIVETSNLNWEMS